MSGSAVVEEDRLDDLHNWLADRAAHNRMEVTRVPLAAMSGWRQDPETGNLVHDSGRFYTVEGLHVRTDRAWAAEWTQPIMLQDEVGMLGILVKEIDGLLHCLMQAKVEPGNVNGLQLSPTVQATRSNFTAVHGGRRVKYLEHFTGERGGRVLVDSLQSEQGSWFLGKRNRNMIVQVMDDVEVDEDFRWVGLDRIGALLREDNVINMDSRTVLSCLPPSIVEQARGAGGRPTGDDFGELARRSFSGAGRPRHTTREALSRLTSVRATTPLARRRVPLGRTAEDGWRLTDEEISRADARYFKVIGVEVRASRREVASWGQPLIAPAGQGLVALMVQQIGGELHALVRARTEAGTLNVAELGPTVQCLPANHAGVPDAHRPPYLAQALDHDPSRVRLDVVHSEEGGRFHHALNRYLVLETRPGELPHPAPDFTWLTLGQIAGLLQHSNYVNVELRSLIACLLTL
ncbi:NDP-hexose 2,3-dehydratase family protein [Streptomyces sp. NPDC058335]|uniref:NDP-hexose 2,3-dehydratase family protein n=1 Tax=Streptomyces sp. NPDC058335 TaxID=3346451 RepID=UPI003665A340